MNYLISCTIFLNDRKLDKVIKVKNKDNEEFAKYALEAYLKRKYPSVEHIVFTSCEHYKEPNIYTDDNFLKDFFNLFSK